MFCCWKMEKSQNKHEYSPKIMLEKTTCATLSFNKNKKLHHGIDSGHRHHLSVFPVPVLSDLSPVIRPTQLEGRTPGAWNTVCRSSSSRLRLLSNCLGKLGSPVMSHQDNYVICCLLYTAAAGLNMSTTSLESVFYASAIDFR